MTKTPISPPYEEAFARGAERLSGLSADQFTRERNALLYSFTRFIDEHRIMQDPYNRSWSDGQPYSYFDGWSVAAQQEMQEADILPFTAPGNEKYDRLFQLLHQDAALINTLAVRYGMRDNQFPNAARAAFQFREAAIKLYQERLLVTEANALNNKTISRRALREGLKNAIHPWKAFKRQGAMFLIQQLAHINPIIGFGVPLAARGITRATYEATALTQGREVYDGKQWWRIKLSDEEQKELKNLYRNCVIACQSDGAMMSEVVDGQEFIRTIEYQPQKIDFLMESLLLFQPTRKFCGIYLPVMAYRLFRHALEPKQKGKLVPHRARPRRTTK